MARVTEVLKAVQEGDASATAEFFTLVYDELKRLAANCMNQESPNNTLQPTALVHEAYIRLMGDASAPAEDGGRRWGGRGHFMAAAAEAMRRILIESARRRKTQKRGGGLKRNPLDPDQIAQPETADELLALDEALTSFSRIEPQTAELVKLRYFGGLTLKEAAAALGIPSRTADAHWAYARAWLLTEMSRGNDPGGC